MSPEDGTLFSVDASPLTDRHIALVRDSFARMSDNGEGAAVTFYDCLFELEPRLRYLFAEDLAEQRRHFIFTIGYVVRRMHVFHEIESHLRNLGIRHAIYGIQDRDFDSFKDAMLRTLTEAYGFGDDPETLDAWSTLFTLVSRTMLEASGCYLTADATG